MPAGPEADGEVGLFLRVNSRFYGTERSKTQFDSTFDDPLGSWKLDRWRLPHLIGDRRATDFQQHDSFYNNNSYVNLLIINEFIETKRTSNGTVCATWERANFTMMMTAASLRAVPILCGSASPKSAASLRGSATDLGEHF